MKNVVEVLITVKEENEQFLECIQSLNESKSDIKITISPFDHSGVGNARINAFNNSTEEYLCFIDPDDYVIGNPFKKAIIYLNEGYTAYYSNHYNIKNNAITSTWFQRLYYDKVFQKEQMHHTVVYKRSVIEKVMPFLRNVNAWDKYLLNLESLISGTVKGDNTIHYAWRVDGGGNHLKSPLDNPPEWHQKIKHMTGAIRKK